MMLRTVDGHEIEVERLGPMRPIRVLFEFDGPRTWLSKDLDGQLLLLHQCGESSATWQYFVVPFSESLVRALENGDIDLHQALNQPRLWIAEFDCNGVRKLLQTSFSNIPTDWIPNPGVMLYQDLKSSGELT